MASLGDGLLATYRQYKRDTELIAGWLAENASKYGCRPRRRNGAAVMTSEFVPMAEAITKSEVTIHMTVRNAFRSAIVARRKCTEWYRENAHGDEADQSTDRHVYFTNILQTTWGILITCHLRVKRGKENNLPASVRLNESDFTATSNKFNMLQLDDDLDFSDDNNEDATAVMVKKPTKQKRGRKKGAKEAKKHTAHFTSLSATIIPDEEQIEDEFWFAIYSFLMEMHKVLAIVRQYWQDFKDGKIDLVMASMGTRMAIDLIRRSEVELGVHITRPKRFPETKFPVSKLPALFMGNEHAQTDQYDGVRPESYTTFNPARISTFICSHSDFSLYNIYILLTSWAYEFKTSPNSTGVTNTPLTSAQPEDSERLQDILVYFRLVTKCCRAPYEDEITRAARYVFEKHEVPIWTTFSFRVLLEIESILEGSRDVPWQNAVAVTQMMLRPWDGLKMHDKEGNPLGISEIQETCCYGRHMSNVNGARDWLLHDEPGQCSCIKRHKIVEYESHQFFKLNPLHCGMIVYDLYRSRQSCTIRQDTNHDCYVWAAMHLYVAGRAAFPESLAWPDMEFFLHQQDAAHLFFGGIPTSLAESERKIVLACGLSTAMLAKDGWKAHKGFDFGKLVRKNKWRLLQDTSVLGFCFEERMHTCDGCDHESLSQTLVRDLHAPKALARLAGQLGMDEEDKDRFVQMWEGRLKSWTLENILELTQLYLSVDRADVGFDFMTLEQTCREMWKKVLPIKGCEELNLQVLVQAVFTILRAADAGRAVGNELFLDVELKHKAPAFYEMWSLIQDHCREKMGTGREGEMEGFASEQGIASLMMMYGERSRFRTEVLGPQVPSFFRNWPPELLAESASLTMAERDLLAEDGRASTADEDDQVSTAEEDDQASTAEEDDQASAGDAQC